MASKAKLKTVYFCTECGCESAKWSGQCPSCGAWNTMTEHEVSSGLRSKEKRAAGYEAAAPLGLKEISSGDEKRISSGISEFDRVLGGGIVPGSLTLVGGDPGIGKSTLLLQVCRELSLNGVGVLYVSGEESPSQIKMRAGRLGDFGDSLKLLCETDLTAVSDVMREMNPAVAVIDSIQTMYNEDVQGTPGAVSQVRESTAVLLRLAKTGGAAVFIVGHVTKEGMVAGPRMLEHMVDTVLYFEGDRHASYRVLRGVKNRFGSTNEIGVFEMQEKGLSEVKNPSEYLLEGRPENASGTVTSCTMEGTRPLLLEIQALVCQTSFGIPRRQASGADTGRVNLLMAVLEKRLGLHMGGCDAYVNVAGGMRITEPAVDLAIALSIVSSFMNIPAGDRIMAVGEVGLSGEVRSVNRIEQRVAEAANMGYEECMLPGVCMQRLKDIKAGNIKLIPVDSVKDAVDYLKKRR
ncbi:MAG: DNA repair protein RadA [Lachnospiraceae bacterium]|nr:DNA repair protein RadA [Lachnospiraceae bacterium]